MKTVELLADRPNHPATHNWVASGFS